MLKSVLFAENIEDTERAKANAVGKETLAKVWAFRENTIETKV